jgi:hypothetical protein
VNFQCPLLTEARPTYCQINQPYSVWLLRHINMPCMHMLRVHQKLSKARLHTNAHHKLFAGSLR